MNCHHKGGSTLMFSVFTKLCEEFDWRFVWHHWSAPDQLPREADVVLFAHSQFDLAQIRTPYRGVHLVRDPRDIVVSGYQYHLTTRESWCVNDDLDETSPITAPRVPMWKESSPEDWKRDYLRRLKRQSYQANLNALPTDEGIAFEIAGYSSWTIDQMRRWNYDDPQVVELKFEDVLANYDAEMRRMFEAIGLEAPWIERAVEIAATEDLGRMDLGRLEADPHIKSRGRSRWEAHLNDAHRTAFKERFGDVVVQLGYAETNDW